MTRLRLPLGGALMGPIVAALAACGDGGVPSPTPSASQAPTPPGETTVADLSPIACATEDPDGVRELTGAWAGSAGGIYYIRHVGDCVWWFGTEVDDIEPGVTGQPGFANVASGRMVGTRIDLEWADVPLGNILNGGGLTFVYEEANDTLTLSEQRGGGVPFGDSVLTRIEPSGSPKARPTSSAGP